MLRLRSATEGLKIIDMAKDRERAHARILYVDKGKTAKQIAAEVGVNENTVGNWIAKYKWGRDRAANALNKESRQENLIGIVSDLAANRLTLQRQLMELIESKADTEEITEVRKAIFQVDDAVSKWNKTFATVKKDNEINQLTLINVADIIFKHFDSKYPHLFKESVEFQDYFINEVVELYSK